jgi:membrane protein DedA with SNARE-associated domain
MAEGAAMEAILVLGGLFAVVALEQALVLHGFPIEVVLPLALMRLGRTPGAALVVLIVGVAATTIGAWVAYEAGRAGRGRLAHGRFARVSVWISAKIQGRAPLVGVLRVVPIARSIVSPMAGVAGMPRIAYFGWTTLGNLVFVTFIVGATMLWA